MNRKAYIPSYVAPLSTLQSFLDDTRIVYRAWDQGRFWCRTREGFKFTVQFVIG